MKDFVPLFLISAVLNAILCIPWVEKHYARFRKWLGDHIRNAAHHTIFKN